MEDGDGGRKYERGTTCKSDVLGEEHWSSPQVEFFRSVSPSRGLECQMVTKVLWTQWFIPKRTKVSAQDWPMDRPRAIRLFEQAGQEAGVLCKDLYPLPDHMQVHLLPGPHIHLSSWPSLSPRFVKDQCDLAGFPDSSVSKESAYNAGDLFDSRIGKFCWRRHRLPTPVFLAFPCGSAGKESACNAGDQGLISGLGRSPGGGKGYPLLYYDLENSTGSIVHGGHRESDTPEWLSLSLHLHCNLNGKKEIEGFDELGGGGLVIVSDSCDFMGCSIPGSSVHRISKESSQPRDWTPQSPALQVDSLLLSHKGRWLWWSYPSLISSLHLCVLVPESGLLFDFLIFITWLK